MLALMSHRKYPINHISPNEPIFYKLVGKNLNSTEGSGRLQYEIPQNNAKWHVEVQNIFSSGQMPYY